MKIDVRSSLSGAPDRVRYVAIGGTWPKSVTPEEFDAAPLSTVLLREEGARVLLIGLGEVNQVDAALFHRATGAAVKHLLKIGSKEIALELKAFPALAGTAVEGAILASYKFDEFRPADKRRKHVLARLQVIVPEHELNAARVQVQEAETVGEAVNTIRAIGNLPGNLLTPAILADKAKVLFKGLPVKLKIWDEKQLARDGFGGILSVGQGSAHPPRFIVMEYRGGGKKEAPVALVGKAVTFDSGGISIKPSDRMDEMKWDKMGGLAVLGIMIAAAKLKLPLNLIGLVPSAENLPGPHAYRPGDILTTVDGKTVEVLNTDAEGRIILADAIAHARLVYKPASIIEFSTLTGACLVALGGKRAGLFTAEDKLRDAVLAAAKATGDLVWPLPIDEEFKEATLSEVALAKNTGGREGGASIGASFVKLWAENVPFVHLDIAGPAWITKDVPHLEKGATGFGVRLALEVLRSWVK